MFLRLESVHILVVLNIKGLHRWITKIVSKIMAAQGGQRSSKQMVNQYHKMVDLSTWNPGWLWEESPSGEKPQFDFDIWRRSDFQKMEQRVSHWTFVIKKFKNFLVFLGPKDSLILVFILLGQQLSSMEF